jgi:hypothetical protein
MISVTSMNVLFFLNHNAANRTKTKQENEPCAALKKNANINKDRIKNMKLKE